jgi:hypothetical protein
MYRFIYLLLFVALAGCGSPAPNAPVAEAPHDHDHDHAAGPHGGTILELGEHHGELVHDDVAGTVTVYILDGAAAENVPVDAKEATINITREGLAKQFPLTATPVEGEAEGKSSRFVSSDKELGTELDTEGVAAVFVMTIGEQQVRAMVEHAHDHDHDHAHGDDHAHEGEEGHAH